MKDKLDIVVGDLTQIGGVSTHVNRLVPFLKREGIDFIISSPPERDNGVRDAVAKSYWFIRFLFKTNENLVHFHKSFGFLQYFYWFIFSRVNSDRVIITIHNDSVMSYGILKRRIVIALLRATTFEHLIVVSDKLFDYLSRNDLECHYLPAHVPLKQVESVVLDKDKPMFMYSVYRATKENLVNIYGFDIALDLLSKFKERYNMLFLVGDKKKSDTGLINAMIGEKNLESNVILLYNKDLVKYIRNCEFILRPNRKDGYGISLQEAIDLGVMAVASNVCKRPEGTVIYKNFSGLIEIVSNLQLINNSSELSCSKRSNGDFHNELIELYRKLIKK